VEIADKRKTATKYSRLNVKINKCLLNIDLVMIRFNVDKRVKRRWK